MASSLLESKEMDINNNNYNPFSFEGCEKRLVLFFEGSGDLHRMQKSKWIGILEHAQCAILNTISNKECIAHLLSESALFIFKQKLMIKTCGRTTLLNILPFIMEECNKMDLKIDNVFYSRSNFMFPSNQPLLHRSFENEQKKLNQYFKGNGVSLGSLQKSRWHCYHSLNVDNIQRHKTLEIVLFDLEPECMQYYFERNIKCKSLTDKLVISGCCISSRVRTDSHLFAPCGYSLNAILDDGKYWTIHITPEREASFVSFETNYDYSQQNGYKYIIGKVVQFFKPKRFSFAVNQYGDHQLQYIKNINFNHFKLSDRSNHKFAKNHIIEWANYYYHDQHDEDEKKHHLKNHSDILSNSPFSEISNQLK